MDPEKGRRRSRRLSTLEKILIFLFLAMTAVCIALIVIYFTEKSNPPTHEEGPASGCGGPQDLTGESGTFTSFNYPNSYDNGKSCVWHITVDPDKVIHLWFEEFALEETDLCTGDAVKLRDSLGSIGEYCGYIVPKPVVSLTNSLTVYFDTNEKKTDQGFKAHYKAVAPKLASEIVGAGGFLQGDKGDMMTPGFPDQDYPNGALYQWRITVPEGEKVHLTFTSFDLVPDRCGDFVQVYDGYEAGSSSLGQFCGETLPKEMQSSGNTMVVRFKSDHQFTSKGFRANYTKSSRPPVVPTTTTTTATTTTTPTKTTTTTTKTTTTTTTKTTTTTPTKTTTTTTTKTTTAPAISSATDSTSTSPAPTSSGIGGPEILYGRKGEIQSLGYPNAYPAGSNNSWRISVSEGFLVKVQLTDLAIAGETGQCTGDKLVISDIYSTLGTHCGYIIPHVMVSASNTIFVTFQSDYSLTDRGFFAKWEAIYPEDITEIQGCGVSSKEETGVIKSQNWPSNYKANSECMWNIVAPSSKNITLTFTHFDLEARDLLTFNCYDNIMVYDINGETNALIKKHGPFCGTTMPSPIQTQGSRLLIRFNSDLLTEAKGFRAYWTTDPSFPAPTEPPAEPNPWDDTVIDWPASCGKPAIPPTVLSRIVNGEPARPHSWPWQVSMQVWPESRPEPSFSHTCGGTLIHKNWVLTAAHCFINYADQLQRWRMCLGKHNLTYTEPSERCFNVSGIYRHEGFQYPTVPTVEFDIALIKLDGDVTPSDEISYACLPSVEEMLPADHKCYATGWGDETGNSLDPVAAEALNQVALPVVPFDICKRMDYWWFQVKTSMICCGYTLPDELKSVCQGDSGGPLVCQNAPNDPWEVHGITSFGPIGCIMDKKPSVFTRSSAYIPWIENIIRREIYYEYISGCGGPKDLNGTEGTVSSMGFPESYSNNANCQWNIQVPPGKLVFIKFIGFYLEQSSMCLNDKVSLTDRVGTLGTYCSSWPYDGLLSDGNTLHVSFSSNDRVVDSGFMAEWRAIDPTEALCGGTFSSNQGEIISPGWSTDRHLRTVCTWRITIPSATSVHVTFTHFELQFADLIGGCTDYVEVFNGESMESLGRFCGVIPPPTITIPGNTVVIRYRSYQSQEMIEQMGIRGYWTTDANVFPTLPPPTPQPWDNITINWPVNCGNPAVTPNTATARVVNGEEAIPYSWPWQVSMQVFSNYSRKYEHYCGGILIHEEWILTTAYCILSDPQSSSLWQMCLGKHHMNSTMDIPSAEKCFDVDHFIPHESYVLGQTGLEDIALVHLAEPVIITDEISPICLPTPGAILPGGTRCFATGWGNNTGTKEQLNQAALPIIDLQTCSKPAYWWSYLRNSMICAGYESPDVLKAACRYDFGGPLACARDGSNTTWEAHGIVSFGPPDCVTNKKPTVFTRISAFSDWIDNNIKKFLYESGRTN